MVKSGLIIGAVTFILALGASLITPLCAPCVAIILGLVAGYLAGNFDKPMSQGDSAKAGAVAGVIALVLGLIGGLIAGVINAAVVGPSGNAEIMRLLGLPPADPTSIWIGQIGGACCIGLVNLAIGAGLGALGGILWWSTTGSKNVQPPIPPSYPPSNFVPPA